MQCKCKCNVDAVKIAVYGSVRQCIVHFNEQGDRSIVACFCSCKKGNINDAHQYSTSTTSLLIEQTFCPLGCNCSGAFSAVRGNVTLATALEAVIVWTFVQEVATLLAPLAPDTYHQKWSSGVEVE